LAKNAGLDGIVCSVHEAAAVRKACGEDFIIVTPGIRPKGADVQDQKRIATASQALKAGASFIVMGRPILEAQDPLKAAKDILEELR
jgi:orotidine-5'-phosphate decarboxylase